MLKFCLVAAIPAVAVSEFLIGFLGLGQGLLLFYPAVIALIVVRQWLSGAEGAGRGSRKEPGAA